MIVGIGTDIIGKDRIAKAYQAHGQHFARKLLSVAELEILATKAQPIDYLAKRWAAKEALGKAVGSGIRKPLLFTNISVLNDALGRPYFELADELAEFVSAKKIDTLHLSISDEKTLAIAWVICEHLH